MGIMLQKRTYQSCSVSLSTDLKEMPNYSVETLCFACCFKYVSKVLSFLLDFKLLVDKDVSRIPVFMPSSGPDIE